ncbi:MAG: 2-C-methyl-D-erythritol 2,4-cyclodiphosphate synthase [Chloroflexi bacterium]|nr:MAG: 2-C-methyl-D-erythritol 2,4-cyclodiphosphate synthase [Chloroflexota bacterium]TME14132.1 MAG: 2-C-methyl-D-erythritol 2,4-cyclodiphosphate synthase [Chloroflexota bacterium]TME18304.1 MAG: 2-C-methyl-D-erythritol 2,4-cyclodiphosphate synthase [Chloroflexota bacterium]
MRVGLGYDAHRLVKGRPLVIGGVEIKHPKGLDGHSDADVLCHALIDAMLGAAALGTIGEHFPADEPELEGISSLELLAMTASLIEDAGRKVVNVDSVVIAEVPRLQPHLREMARSIAETLGIDQDLVGVKATSPEGLGSLGRQEGIAAQAVVLLE